MAVKKSVFDGSGAHVRSRGLVTVLAAAMLAGLSVRDAYGVVILYTGSATTTVDSRVGGSAEAWTAITPGPTFSEEAVGEIASGIAITPPAGWSFRTTGAAVGATVNSGNIVLGAPSVSAKLIQFAVTGVSTAISSVTIDGIELKPDLCIGTGSHTVLVTTAGPGTKQLSNRAAAYVLLDSGVIANLTASAAPSSVAVGSSSTITITARDACNNLKSNYALTGTIAITAGAHTGTLTYASASSGTISGSSITNPTFNPSGQVTVTVTDDTAETVSFTPAVGAVTASSFDVSWAAVTGSCDLANNIHVDISADPADLTKVIVTITGTNNPDAIAVGAVEGEVPAGSPDGTPPEQNVTVNGETFCGNTPLLMKDVSSFVINALGGDDDINCSALVRNTEADPPIDNRRPVTVNAGSGNDVVIGGEGNDILNGDDGNDTLKGGPGSDTINGGAGQDDIYGQAGSDTLSGGPGIDTLHYDTAVADSGADLPEGSSGVVGLSPMAVRDVGSGIDTIDISAGNEFEVVILTELDDTFYASDVDTIIYGGEGNDTLYGGAGDDELYGEAGNDTLYGLAGDDLLNGGDDDDTLYGDDPLNPAVTGDDTLMGGAGDDIGFGGPGNDRIIEPTQPKEIAGDGDDTYHGGDGDDYIEGGDGDDTLYGDAGMDTIRGGDGDDAIYGGTDDDMLYGEDGDDSITGGAGNDALYGGDGDDFLYGDDPFDLTIQGDDLLEGGDGDDYLDGGPYSDIVDGGPGDDITVGGDGNDHIICGPGDDGTMENPVDGGPGDDIVEGGDGDDVLTGGSGRNVIIGNAGDDTLISAGEYDVLDYRYDGGPSGVNVDFSAGEATDSYGGTDQIWKTFRVCRGTGLSDTIKADPDIPMVFLGGGGGDTLIGSARAGDILYGEGGDDTIYGDPDPLPGGFRGGADILMGGSGSDTIYGGPGADEIYGDGDYVPQNFDEDTTAVDYYPDDQMIQLWVHPLSALTGRRVYFIHPHPTQAHPADPANPIAMTDSILDIGACLHDYGQIDAGTGLYGPQYNTTVLNSFALPCSELVASGFPSLDHPGVPPGNDTIHGGGGGDFIAGGGGNDTIYGGSDQMSKNSPISHTGDPWNIDTGDYIYGDYVCNRPEALLRGGGWLETRGSITEPNGLFARFSDASPLDTTHYRGTIAALPNGMPPPRDPTPTWNDTAYPDPAAPGSLPTDMERAGGDDEIHAGFGTDVVMGGGGSDTILGNRDEDVLYGDFFFGEERDDTYRMISTRCTVGGSDLIRGNEGRDYIYGGPGGDYLFGGDPAEGDGWDWADTGRPEFDEGETVVVNGVYYFFASNGGGDVMQGNAGSDMLVGCDMYGLPLRDVNPADNDPIDRGFDASFYPSIDTGPADTADYSMVPPAPGPTDNWGGTGIVIQLGDNVAGGYPSAGTASNDGEGGVDTLYGIENVVGTRQADIITGSSRNDSAQYTGRMLNNAVSDAFGRLRFPDYFNHPSGYSYNRTALRSGYDNILLGEDGDDLLIGRRGRDALCGGNGNDELWGDGHDVANPAGTPPVPTNPDDPSTSGDDELWGDAGDDKIYGEWGNDIVHGGLGTDYMSGGNGTDILAYSEDDESDGFNGFAANLSEAPVNLGSTGSAPLMWDTLFQTYSLIANWPVDPLSTTVPVGGFPVTTVTVPDDAADPLSGATIQIQFPGGNVLPAFGYNPNLVTTPGVSAPAENRGLATAYANGSYDVIVNRDYTGTRYPGSIYNPDRFEIVQGTMRNDVIYGHDLAPNIIYGDAGNDILVGGAGDDVIEGNLGSDILEGGLGNDELIGGEAFDTPPGLQEESDADWVSFYHTAPLAGQPNVGVVVNLSETQAQDTRIEGTDLFVGINHLLGSRMDDILTGNSLPNNLLGDDGADWLAGRADQDINEHNRVTVTSDLLMGGAGTDTADYRTADPIVVAASIASLQWGPCTVDPTHTCGVMINDGQGGSDTLMDIEDIRQADGELQLTSYARGVVATRTVIAPDKEVRLDFEATGGDGRYVVEFTPTTTMKDRLDENERVVGQTEIAILVAPADQGNPATPFTPETDLPEYKAVRKIEGMAGGNGKFRFTVYARPLETTTFRITVKDMGQTQPGTSAPALKTTSRTVQVVVAEPLVVGIEQTEYMISAGQQAQLRATVSGGATPYQIRWTASDNSQATTLSSTTSLIPMASPTVTTTYTIEITDALGQVETAKTKVTVTAGSAANPSGNPQDDSGSAAPSSGSNNNETADTPSGNSTPNEVSDVSTDGENTTAVVPACGFGVTSWVAVANLLALAVLKRRRY